MGVRVSASTTTLNATANIPANTAVTIMGDSLIVSDRGSAMIQPVCSLINASLTDSFALMWETTAGGDGVMLLQVADAGVVISTGTFGSRPAVGSAFAWYMKCSGTGANLVEAGWRYPGGAWVTVTATLGATIAAPTQILFGAVSTVFANIRYQNIKVWDRALSLPELQAESLSDSPVSKVALNRYCPCPHFGDVFDRSGLNRNLTRATTVTTEQLVFPRSKRVRRPALFVAAATFQAAWARHANTIIQVAGR